MFNKGENSVCHKLPVIYDSSIHHQVIFSHATYHGMREAASDGVKIFEEKFFEEKN